MKPHAMRKLLWIGNAALLAGVAMAGANLFMEVKPATAATLARKPGKISKKYDAIVKQFEKKRRANASWQPKPPVTQDEVLSIFIDKWTKPTREQAHFPFVGPQPPAIAKKVADTGVKAPPKPSGLVTIGEPTVMVFAPPADHVMLFEFKSGESQAFGIGDWISESEKSDERFKLLDLERIVEDDEESYLVHYGVYDDGKEEKRASVLFSNPKDWGEERDMIQDVVREVAGVAKVGTTGAGAAGAKKGDAGTTEIREPLKPAEVVVVGEPTLAQAKPEVQDYGNRRKAIVFNERTRAYFKGKNAAKLAESVKTEVAKSGGRVVGLRVTGYGNDLNGDVFDVRKGDILVSINGVPIRDRSGVVQLVRSLPQDKLVTVVIKRRGKDITYRVDPSDPKNRRRVRYFENVEVPGK